MDLDTAPSTQRDGNPGKGAGKNLEVFIKNYIPPLRGTRRVGLWWRSAARGPRPRGPELSPKPPPPLRGPGQVKRPAGAPATSRPAAYSRRTESRAANSPSRRNRRSGYAQGLPAPGGAGPGTRLATLAAGHSGSENRPVPQCGQRAAR